MTDIRDLLAQNIKKYRSALGLSQAKLAEKVDTSTNYIGLLEIKRKFPSPEMMERIAAALGIDTPELFHKELASLEAIKTYRKAAIEDIHGVISKAIEEKLADLDKEV
ncbi:MAG: helix-turn-helix transcriptional regulator [Spirochaetaceae bacterium]|jgi:transcriptional regulator with XRE-family HTH domain|nr:helix-turn-helix transcriptional regulator [Spirochaetaceae bacterium]